MTMALPLQRIRLNLARSKQFPSGSVRHGYEFVAPLDKAGHIDPTLWKTYRDQCRVRRFWGATEENGRLIHRSGGAEHAQWIFDYNPANTNDDEPGYRFASHAFILGEYVSIRDHHGEMQTFQVASVGAAP